MKLFMILWKGTTSLKSDFIIYDIIRGDYIIKGDCIIYDIIKKDYIIKRWLRYLWYDKTGLHH